MLADQLKAFDAKLEDMKTELMEMETNLRAAARDRGTIVNVALGNAVSVMAMARQRLENAMYYIETAAGYPEAQQTTDLNELTTFDETSSFRGKNHG